MQLTLIQWLYFPVDKLVASKSKRAWKFQCIFGSPQQMAGPSRESKEVLTRANVTANDESWWELQQKYRTIPVHAAAARS